MKDKSRIKRKPTDRPMIRGACEQCEKMEVHQDHSLLHLVNSCTLSKGNIVRNCSKWQYRDYEQERVEMKE